MEQPSSGRRKVVCDGYIWNRPRIAGQSGKWEFRSYGRRCRRRADNEATAQEPLSKVQGHGDAGRDPGLKRPHTPDLTISPIFPETRILAQLGESNVKP